MPGLAKPTPEEAYLQRHAALLVTNSRLRTILVLMGVFLCVLTLGFVAEEESESESKAHSGLDGKLQAKPGTTVLDRVHQAMILFGAGRSEALRRFLVDDGAGKDDRFWRLGQALAALYPTGTDERRWIEGVMARKKGLGL